MFKYNQISLKALDLVIENYKSSGIGNNPQKNHLLLDIVQKGRGGQTQIQKNLDSFFGPSFGQGMGAVNLFQKFWGSF